MISLLTTIAGVAGCALLGFLLIGWVRHAVLNRACRAAFANAFSQEPVPTYKLGYSYGVPVFCIAFRSESDYLQARTSGRTDSFVSSIQGLCEARFGSRERPYEASRAVEFHWQSEGGKAKVASVHTGTEHEA